MTSPVTSDVLKAAQVLAAGHLCAIPTETVYGLAADATNESAVSRVFAAKGRPTDHPLIVHVATFQDAQNWFSDLPEWAGKLADKYWPGPLTLVGKRTNLALDVVTGNQDTVAVRVPAHPVTQHLLQELKQQKVLGLVAPSANKFGEVSPTSAQHVVKDLGEYLTQNHDLILDGGQSGVGLESTIVLATGTNPVILRPGAITEKDIFEVTGLEILSSTNNQPRVSGSLDSHYAPNARVLIVQAAELPNESNAGFVGMNNLALPKNLTVLLAAKDLTDYATNLYQALRHADELGLTKIYAVLPPAEGLGIAIRDRLSRAAH